MIGNYYYGTGRRKSSVARVFMKAGSGALPGLEQIPAFADFRRRWSQGLAELMKERPDAR